MRLSRIAESSQAFAAHASLFFFTLLLVLKLDHRLSYSWRVVFFPLFLFHVVVARKRSSLRGPSVSDGRYVASRRVPLLIVFELLLFVFLEGAYVSLKIVFLPLLAFEIAILVDNFRMCQALLRGHVDILSDAEAISHFSVAISMIFFFLGTLFTLRKISGDTGSSNWWGVFLYFGIAECFVFLVCTKWCNPTIHRNSQIHVGSSSSTARYLYWNSDVMESTEDISEHMMCSLCQDTVGHVFKILIIGFQILLCIHLEGKPAAARFIPIPVVFSPIFLVQGFNLVEKVMSLLPPGVGTRIYIACSTNARDSVRFFQRGFRLLGRWSTTRARDFLGFFRRGFRLLGRWSTNEGSRKGQARNGSSGYNTFSGNSPEIVKTLPKKDPFNEDENLCKICYDREKNMVLLPCSHHILCSICGVKCQTCPICRAVIEKRMLIYDA